jgi:4-amino-4-deoxy-L-arabinose transferase-like glycosyltransferase
MSKTALRLILLFVAGFVLRLASNFYLGIDKDPGPPWSDAWEYNRYAWNLSQGNGFRGHEPGQAGEVLSAYLPPGAPALFATLYFVFGRNYAVLRVVQCLLGAGTAILLFYIAWQLFGSQVAWVAGVAFALYPASLFYSHALLTESLYTFSLLLFVMLCVRHLAPVPTWKGVVLTGIVLGLTALIRPTILSFLLFFAIWCLLACRTMKTRLQALVVVLIAGAVILPWSLRNYRLYDRFVLITPTAWTVFIQGNNSVVANDPKYAGYCVWYTQVPEWADKFDGLPQIDREPVAKKLGLQWLAKNHDKWGLLVRAKFIRFWSPFLKQESRLNRLIMLVSWGSVLVLSLPAFFVTLVKFIRERSAGIILHLFVLSATLNAVIYFGLPRYRYPMEPFCIILAGVTVTWLWDKIVPNRRTE